MEPNHQWSTQCSGACDISGTQHSAPFRQSFCLEALTEDEFERRATLFAGISTSGELSVRMAEICREPFMLRLVAEVYQDGKLCRISSSRLIFLDGT